MTARLTECLPNAIKVEAIDNLARARQRYYPNGSEHAPATRPLDAMLSTTRALWTNRDYSCRPTIVLCARLATPFARRKSYRAAHDVHAPFRLVVARSRKERAMRRMCRLTTSERDLDKRLAAFRKATRSFREVTAAERRLFPTLVLDEVLADLDASTEAVVQWWLRSP